MHGFPQTGKFAHGDLVKRLVPFGCKPAQLAPGLWANETKLVSFALVLGDFGVEHAGASDFKHPTDALSIRCKRITDHTGCLCAGALLGWHYANEKVRCSVPRCVPDFLKKFNHLRDFQQKLSPYPSPMIKHGAKV